MNTPRTHTRGPRAPRLPFERLPSFRHRLRTHSTRAFTLVEIIVAGSISTVFLAAAAVFTYFIYEQMFIASEETRFNATVRTLNVRMAEDIREAGWFAVYPSFALADRNEPADRRSIGNGGNLLVLFYTRSRLTTEPSHEVIVRIVGYYADPATINADGAVALKRFEIAPAAGETWYYNPNITSANYVPASAISPDFTVNMLEDYFAGVTAATPGIESVVFLENPSINRPLFYNRNTYVTIVAGTLFGNSGHNMRQTYNFSTAPQG